eukprot:s582_g8.t1
MSAVHAKLLLELRSRSKAAPTVNAEKSMPPERPRMELTSFSRQMDMLLPLVVAAWRCKLVRDAAVIFLGGWWQRPVRIMTGLLFLVVGIRGLPGGSAFLEAGFYAAKRGLHGKRNEGIRQAFEVWLKSFVPCPWQLSGELCTILPYLLNRKRFSNLQYERCWLDAEDGERFAFDCVFPDTGFDPDAPVVVLLTGLAAWPCQHDCGGFDCQRNHGHASQQESLSWCARHRLATDLGSNETCSHQEWPNCCCGDCAGFLLGEEDFREKRTAGLRHSCLETASGQKPKLFAAGYSMGGIILANYCGHYSQDPLLRGAIHFSGVHDAVFNMNFKYSEETWQAYLAYNLKWSIVSAAPVEEAMQWTDSRTSGHLSFRSIDKNWRCILHAEA